MRSLIIIFLLLALSGCTQVFFQPHQQLVNTPTQFGIAFQNEYLTAADGTQLNAWWLPAVGAPRGTILFLHGNAENISTHFRSVAWLPAAGYNVLALDYRGYGASAGVPTLAGVQQDIDAAMRHLLVQHQAQGVVVMGQSLGGALAIFYSAHSAYREQIRAVVSDSAFSDYRVVAREGLVKFWLTWPLQWLPWLVIDNDYAPLAAVAEISPIPLLIIHGTSDSVVNSTHAQGLFNRARKPKQLWLIREAEHIQALSIPDVRQQLLEFLQHSLVITP
ncbi:MAG: alpha/beta hydrolase [Sideroxydans sp.]|nr:alpha/beta hydrolase [Sideroxydans sp.]